MRCRSLEEQGVITQCDIATLSDQAEPMNLQSGAIITNRVQMKSSCLRECLSDLDMPGGDAVSVTFSPELPFFCLGIKGDSAECNV
jgi:hypothetical protein